MKATIEAARTAVPEAAKVIRNAGNFERVELEYVVSNRNICGDTNLQKAAQRREMEGTSSVEAAEPVILQECTRIFERFYHRGGKLDAVVRLTDSAGKRHRYRVMAKDVRLSQVDFYQVA